MGKSIGAKSGFAGCRRGHVFVKSSQRRHRMHIRTLANRGVPLQVLRLIILALATTAFDWVCPEAAAGVEGWLSMLEMFAGVANVASAFSAVGLRAMAFDLRLNDILHDILSPAGFAFALWVCCVALPPGAFVMLAPVCSSWVWMCSSVSKRSKGRPMGDRHRLFVRVGNRMVSRVAILLMILSARGVVWALEQPASSVMQYHPRFQEVLRIFNVHQVTLDMGAYGGCTRKPSVLYSIAPEICEMYKRAAADQVFSVSLVTKDAEGGVTGSKAALKHSQCYPPEFAKQLAAWFVRHMQEFQSRGGATYDSDAARRIGYKWLFGTELTDSGLFRDARLTAVFQFLQVGPMRAP
jgi:hypothetical protein